MFSAGSGGAWSQEASHARASDAVRPCTTKEDLALRKRNERTHTANLWATLALLAPSVDEDKGKTGRRTRVLQGRTKEQLLKDVVHAVWRAQRLAGHGALGQAFTTQAGGGLIAIELKSGKIVHQSPSFQGLTGWLPVEARGNIRISLESMDGDGFHSFCQSVVRDAGEPYGETFLNRNHVVGRSVTVRFFTRAPGPPDMRNPEWLLMMRAVKLTLVGMQPALGRGQTPEAIGVFAADLSGGTPSQWTVQAAHVRNLLDMETASGTYDMDTENIKPFEQIAMFFKIDFSKEEGVGASVFSRAAARIEYAATRALNIAQRSAWWLTRKALRITHEWTLRRDDDDDTVSILHHGLFSLGGLSTSVSIDFVGGKIGFSHGGLEFLYFIADPDQPLDSNLRATIVRVTSTKTGGGFDVHRPFVLSATFLGGSGTFRLVCKRLFLDTLGKKVSSEEEVSQLFEKLKVSSGVGVFSDGSAAICVGQCAAEPTVLQTDTGVTRS